MASSDYSEVLNLMHGFQKSKVMFVAIRIGVFDMLESSPAGVTTISADLNVSPDGLERLMDACVGLGLLQKDPDGKYANTPVSSTYLCRSSPTTLAGYLLYTDKISYLMWTNLEPAVRDGTNRWCQTFGFVGDMFQNVFENSEMKHEFLFGLHDYGKLVSPRIVSTFDLGRFRRMVDLGGGSGHLVTAACERYPDLVGTVFERPDVAVFTREMVTQSSVAQRIDVIGGDFFQDELPEGDLYSLGRVLHDWKEDEILVLLEKISARLPPGGGLLIVESLLNGNKTGPVNTQLMSLNMLIITEGKERNFDEYEVLLHRAGFGDVRMALTGMHLDAILAIKN